MGTGSKTAKIKTGRGLVIRLVIAILCLTSIRIIAHRYTLIGVESGIIVLAISFLAVGAWLIRKAINQVYKADSVALLEGRLNKLISFLDSTPDPILVADEQGVIRLANSNTEKIFGYRREEMLGLRMEDLITRGSQGSYKNTKRVFYDSNLIKAIETGIDHFVARKDGKEIAVEISLNAVEMDESTWMSAEATAGSQSIPAGAWFAISELDCQCR